MGFIIFIGVIVTLFFIHKYRFLKAGNHISWHIHSLTQILAILLLILADIPFQLPQAVFFWLLLISIRNNSKIRLFLLINLILLKSNKEVDTPDNILLLLFKLINLVIT
jgi:hypothetical protein